MKYAIIIPLILFLILPVSFSQENVPAPFGKIKEFVLKAKPDKDGHYFVEFKVNRDGSEVTYFMAYLKDGIIGIGELFEGQLLVIEYHEKLGKFALFRFQYGISSRVEITPEYACGEAYKIFKKFISEQIV